jgi:hypothetical protein
MRQLYLSALAAAVFAAAGCVQAEQEFTLKADGAAELKFSYAMSEQTIAQIEAMQKNNPDAKAQGGLPFDEKAIRETFEKQKTAGVELKSLKVESKDGTRRINLEASCKDLVAAGKAAGGNKPSGMSLVKNAEGNYVMTIGGGQLGGMGGGDVPEEQKKQQQAMAKTMMAGLKVVVKVNLPADIVESNGKDGMRVTFKGAGLDLKEIKPEPATAEPKGDAEPK